MREKMKVFHIRKYTWFLLGAVATIFVVGNIMLFNKFLNRRTISLKVESGKKALENIGKDMLIKNWKHHPDSPLGKVAELLDKERKEHGMDSNEGVDLNDLRGIERDPKNLPTQPKQQEKQQNKSNNKHIDDRKVEENRERDISHVNMEDPYETRNVKSDKEIGNEVEKDDSKIAVLVISCNRPTYVQRCVDRLLEYRPSAEKFPIIISQDCGHQATANVIRSYGNKVTFIQQPELGLVKGVPGNMARFMGYYKISRHFKFALGEAFDELNHETVLIVEDDLEIAPDFFEYFEATKPLLYKDPTLWCVSAWNDNGKEGLVQSNDLLFRTDFFPGLGWMLTKSVWNELRPKWPLGFWDDWMRQPGQRKGRACIRPDIPRTKTYGKVGVSLGQFYEQHLKFIKLNDKKYPFLKSDLSYLIKDNYDRQLEMKINQAPRISIQSLKSGTVNLPEAKITYSNQPEFERLAGALGAMTDLKSGIARASYRGVVTVMHKRTRIYLIPEKWSNMS